MSIFEEYGAFKDNVWSGWLLHIKQSTHQHAVKFYRFLMTQLQHYIFSPSDISTTHHLERLSPHSNHTWHKSRNKSTVSDRWPVSWLLCHLSPVDYSHLWHLQIKQTKIWKIQKKKMWTHAHRKHDINLYHSMGKFSRGQTDDIFLSFVRKQALTFYAKCLLWRQFAAWNVKTHFLGKIQKKNFKNI